MPAKPVLPSNPRKRIVLGVSASIAAYKAADLASQLVKADIDVFPILTPDATKFITPLTFQALTGHPCPVSTFDEPIPGDIAHIWYARNCDLVVIAPASMDIIAKLANGLADSMLTATALATTSPILLAPAMNTNMWSNPATQANLAKLREFGYYFIEPTTGRLACRTEGVGKLAEVETIYNAIRELLSQNQILAGKRVLVTSGPTREPIDPVRYITNRSSGKMGFAIAEAARLRGAEVILIAGPTPSAPPGGLEVIPVETAAQMRDAVIKHAPAAHFVVAAAAVADYRPETISSQKIKKGANAPSIPLAPTDDILAIIGRHKRSDQIFVGFAAETENIIENAQQKLASKNLDWIVANDVTQNGAGFDVDTNIVTLIGRHGQTNAMPLMTKREVAERIWDAILNPLTPNLSPAGRSEPE